MSSILIGHSMKMYGKLRISGHCYDCAVFRNKRSLKQLETKQWQKDYDDDFLAETSSEGQLQAVGQRMLDNAENP